METEMVRIADQFVGASKNISLTESELYPLRFTPDGYPPHSGSPYRLWFAFGFP